MSKNDMHVEAGLFDCDVRSGNEYREIIRELIESGSFRPAVHANSPRGIRDRETHNREISSFEELVDGWCWDMHPKALENDDRYRAQLGHDMRAYHEAKATTGHSISLLYSANWWPARRMLARTHFEQWKDLSYSDVEFGSIMIDKGDPNAVWLDGTEWFGKFVVAPPEAPAPTIMFPAGDLTAKVRNVNAYMEDLAGVTVGLLYPRLRPSLAYVGALWLPGKTEQDRPSYFARRNLGRLDWVTIFGPAYVEAYGEEFLWNAPGFSKERLGDGGILYRPVDSFISVNPPQPQADEIVSYFESHPKVKRIYYKHRLARDYFVDPMRSKVARERYYRQRAQ
jgi:hypothetical protein